MVPARARDRWGRPVPVGDPAAVDPGIDTDVPRTPTEAVAVGQRLIDDGWSFWAHEVFETQWRTRPRIERDLWQGLAQVCVVLTHQGRNNPVGAERVAARALTTLASPQCETAAADARVDLAAVREWLRTTDASGRLTLSSGAASGRDL